jgi:DMSO/TMAO reductase YedYZ molybdopterin-dependent catalytic subunit
MSMAKLSVSGLIEKSLELTFEQLAALPQIKDVSRFDPKRTGDAVALSELVRTAKPQASARYLGLHSSTDDFHASIPLAPIVDRAFLIYRAADGQPLDANAGGPFRFYIPNHKACHTDEIDECANVKFVDRLEFTAEKGFDNRPHDEAEHADLHSKQ